MRVRNESERLMRVYKVERIPMHQIYGSVLPVCVNRLPVRNDEANVRSWYDEGELSENRVYWTEFASILVQISGRSEKNYYYYFTPEVKFVFKLL